MNGEFMKKNKLTANEVDEQFDNGKSLNDFFTEELDRETYQTKKKKILVKFLLTVVIKIDAIIDRTGTTRNAVIRMLVKKFLNKGKR